MAAQLDPLSKNATSIGKVGGDNGGAGGSEALPPATTRRREQSREFLIGPLQMRCGSLHDCAPWLVNAHEEAASNLKFGTAKKLYGMYKLNALRRHRAAIVLPYAVMSYLFMASLSCMLCVSRCLPRRASWRRSSNAGYSLTAC